MLTINEAQKTLDSINLNDFDPERKKIIDLLESYGLDSYEQKRRELRKAFLIMGSLPNDNHLRQWLGNLIKKSMIYGQKSGDEVYIRRHNTFVQYYVMRLHRRLIQQNQCINYRTIHKDIDFILHKMMIFTYGIDALNPRE